MYTSSSKNPGKSYLSPTLHTLLLAAGGYLFTSGAGAVVAIREDLPGASLGKLSGRSARDDFVKGFGTALSPSLGLLLLHALFIALASRSGRVGTAGVTGLTVNGLLFTIGMLGEPITYQVYNSRTVDPAKIAIVTGNIILPLLMIYAGRKVLMCK